MQDYVRLHRLGRDDIPAGPAHRCRGRCGTGRGQHLRSLARRLEARRPQCLVDHRLQPPEPRLASCPTGCSAASRACSATWAGPWVTMKYGKLAWRRRSPATGGEALRHWIDECPNSSLLGVHVPGRGARGVRAVLADLGHVAWPARDYRSAVGRRVGRVDDQSRRTRHRDDLIESLRAAEAEGDQPTCFVVYTIKGMGLPFAGHKDNHAGYDDPRADGGSVPGRQ